MATEPSMPPTNSANNEILKGRSSWGGMDTPTHPSSSAWLLPCSATLLNFQQLSNMSTSTTSDSESKPIITATEIALCSVLGSLGAHNAEQLTRSEWPHKFLLVSFVCGKAFNCLKMHFFYTLSERGNFLVEHRVSAAMTYSLHDGGFPCVQGLWYCCIRIDYPNLFVRGEVFLDLVIRFEGLADSKNKKRESELLLITQSTHHFFHTDHMSVWLCGWMLCMQEDFCVWRRMHSWDICLAALSQWWESSTLQAPLSSIKGLAESGTLA